MKSSSHSRASAKEIITLFHIYATNEAARISAEDEIAAIIDRNIRSKASPQSDHGKLVELWMVAYKEFFGTPSSFLPRDGKGAKGLLATGLTPEQIMVVAKAAWRFRDDTRKHWNCKFSVTLCGLHAKFNEIRSELGDCLGQTQERRF